MIGHQRNLVAFGSSLLALGLALLVAVPQTPPKHRALGVNRFDHRHPALAPAPPLPVTFDAPVDPSLDLYDLAGTTMFRLYEA